MTHVYDLEAEVLAEIERLEREAQRLRDLAERPAPDADDDERRALGRRADEIKEQIGCLLPNLS
jgi:hypothetical protein